MLNTTWYDFSVNISYNADIISIAVITLSTLAFPIIFSVATWLQTKSVIPFIEDPSKRLCVYLKDPSKRLLRYLTDDKTIGKFLISSMIYLVALLLSLINYSLYIFFSYSKLLIFTLLLCSLFLVIIATSILFYKLIIVLIKALKVDKKDVAELVELIEWLLKNKKT